MKSLFYDCKINMNNIHEGMNFSIITILKLKKGFSGRKRKKTENLEKIKINKII